MGECFRERLPVKLIKTNYLQIDHQITISEAQKILLTSLQSIYDQREASVIADLIMENITGWKKIDQIVNKTTVLSAGKNKLLKKYTEELLAHRPVQYVLNEAWFYGMKFFVNEDVLIPRPETEELVKWIIDENRFRKPGPLLLLDIGTGSGSIPVALKRNLPQIETYSCDASQAAIQVASQNALSNRADVHFLHLDFLNSTKRKSLPAPDIIVSNPPYIPLQDKTEMSPHVVSYEPHLALFVSDSDPFIFYRAIAEFASEKLIDNGKIFTELPADSARDISLVFQSYGFDFIEIRKDMQGKDRMLKATRLP
jgi:release factor glutamine methyltransferase